MQLHTDKAGKRNKFLEAQIIAKRARQLSERKGQTFLEEGRKNPIEQAMRELAEGKLKYILPSQKETHPVEGDENDESRLDKA
jgi:DNA-directed RNA polymerase subunit K/omega